MEETKTEKDLLLEQAIQQLSSTSPTVQADRLGQVDRLKCAVCGDPKTGKSYLIAHTCRKPSLHYDCDDRAESIAECKDVTIKTVVDKQDTQPVAWNIIESDMGTLEYLKEQKKLPYRSLVYDSMTYLRKYAEHQMLKDSGTGAITRAQYKIGSSIYLIPKDWDAVTGVQKMLENLLSRAFGLGIDVYVTFHTKPEKDMQKSTKENIVYKDNLTIEPQNLKMLLPKFNDVWRTYFEDSYRVQLKPDWRFNASTVLKNVKDVEEADIQKMLEKHNNGRK